MAAQWLTKLIGGGLGDMTQKITSGFAELSKAHLGKKELKLAEAELENGLRTLIETNVAEAQNRIASDVMGELHVKRDVVIEEIRSTDEYVKRTRPWVIRSGTRFTFVLVSLEVVASIADGIKKLDFEYSTPDLAYWWLTTYAGLVGVYKIARTVDKRNKDNGSAAGWGAKLASKIAGTG